MNPKKQLTLSIGITFFFLSVSYSYWCHGAEAKKDPCVPVITTQALLQLIGTTNPNQVPGAELVMNKAYGFVVVPGAPYAGAPFYLPMNAESLALTTPLVTPYFTHLAPVGARKAVFWASYSVQGILESRKSLRLIHTGNPGAPENAPEHNPVANDLLGSLWQQTWKERSDLRDAEARLRKEALETKAKEIAAKLPSHLSDLAALGVHPDLTLYPTGQSLEGDALAALYVEGLLDIERGVQRIPDQMARDAKKKPDMVVNEQTIGEAQQRVRERGNDKIRDPRKILEARATDLFNANWLAFSFSDAENRLRQEAYDAKVEFYSSKLPIVIDALRRMNVSTDSPAFPRDISKEGDALAAIYLEGVQDMELLIKKNPDQEQEIRAKGNAKMSAPKDFLLTKVRNAFDNAIGTYRSTVRSPLQHERSFNPANRMVIKFDSDTKTLINLVATTPHAEAHVDSQGVAHFTEEKGVDGVVRRRRYYSTWMRGDVLQACKDAADRGNVRSVAVYNSDGHIVGGLIYAVGDHFTMPNGLALYHHEEYQDTGKLALLAFMLRAYEVGFDWTQSQLKTIPGMQPANMGGYDISKEQYLADLERFRSQEIRMTNPSEANYAPIVENFLQMNPAELEAYLTAETRREREALVRRQGN